MFNEVLFFAHIFVVSVSVLLGLAHSYGAILAVLSLQLILANLFVTKQAILFGMTTTCSEVFTVSGMYGISLIQAYFGTKRAQQTIVYTFGFLLLFVLLSRIHLWYLPLSSNDVGPALTSLLAPAPRMMMASMIAYLISERLHVWLSRRMKIRGISPIARVVAIFLGQVTDTVTFAFIGLYGLVDNLASIIVVSIIVKLVVTVSLAPLLALAQKLIPLQREHNE